MRSKKKVSLTVDQETYAQFRQFCYGNGMKVSTKIEQLIKDLITKRE